MTRGATDRERDGIVPRAVDDDRRMVRAVEAGHGCFDRYPATLQALAEPDPEFERQMAVAREVMRKNHEVLRELAKR